MHELTMSPSPEEHLLRHVGDRLRITLRASEGAPELTRAYLRTNVTRAAIARREVIASAGLRGEHALTFAGASWRDIPLTRTDAGYVIDLPLLEVGHFRAKAYGVDASGRQHWPAGSDLGISVHPDRFRTANTIYCAFPRAMRGRAEELPRHTQSALRELDALGYAVIPPSGTLRGLTRALSHVIDGLGCRIVHLLPVSPVPSTFARMGRYGSPYAQLDLTGIDPALVEFDKRTTGVEQFRELADAVHLRGGALILDVVLNHTGWASRLYEEHPEWFKRNPDGTFHSPGAWGNTWADLVELDQSRSALWDVLAESLITWCQRGVDGFRCDAGYMIPLPAWQYVIARVRDAFPDTLFLLEGLGGSWEATRDLLSAGGMQWAYSELFQCYSPTHIADYLDHAIRESERVGVLVHYSETHDNDRLAKRGAAHANMRNHLCALASHGGGFGFTSGVEWLCTEKIDVHEAHSLAWGNAPNLLVPLARLTRLLSEHPTFFDGATVERVSPRESQVLTLARRSADGLDRTLVLVNLDLEHARSAPVARALWDELGATPVDLLGQPLPHVESDGQELVHVRVGPAQSVCLAPAHEPRGPSGERYRRLRAQAAWAYTQLAVLLPHEALGDVPYAELARFVEDSPEAFLGAISRLSPAFEGPLLSALKNADADYRPVIVLRASHCATVNLVPPDHWVLLRDAYPFAAEVPGAPHATNLRSVPMGNEHVISIPPHDGAREFDVQVALDRFAETGKPQPLPLRFLARTPHVSERARTGLVLLTNGRGGMARIAADFGAVRSKYDVAFAANLDPNVPEDRWVFVKRVRAWVNADGFITPLDLQNLVHVEPGPPAVWTFAANAGDGRHVGVRISVAFVQGRNTLVCRLERTHFTPALPAELSASVTLRLDLEDRNFHQETHHHPELEASWTRAVSARGDARGFTFAPAPGRHLDVWLSAGAYHAEREWCDAVPHPLDAERGMSGEGDAFSPGWFELPLAPDVPVTLTLDAESGQALPKSALNDALKAPAPLGDDPFEGMLRRAVRAFVAKRGAGRTVIAGYPWFLDWGRDTFVAARGLIAAGYHDDVAHMLLTYAALEKSGTLPNYLAGTGEGSRESSDAPLWFSLACSELARVRGPKLYATPTPEGRTLRDVLVSIAENFLAGTPTGIRVDPESMLVWSPSHYTWMDTNYPAGTPREGYPIELAAMFARLLDTLAELGVKRRGDAYAELAARVRHSLAMFYRDDLGFFADTLHCTAGTPARVASPDDHVRPNQLLAITLGLVTDARARSAVEVVGSSLLVPGALRSLAPQPVRFALPIHGRHGELLNDPLYPYFGQYVGDEDTRRKPAYHNGTAWGFWLPAYAEALVRAHPGDSLAHTAASAVLGSCARLLGEGCLGQLPEVIDGDAPHRERGCDAQAWSVSEVLRVWLLLRTAAITRELRMLAPFHAGCLVFPGHG